MLQAITEDLHLRLENTLTDLLVRAEASAVYLCDRGGNILAQSTSAPCDGEENIAALAAGSFYATREVARLLGEAEFRCVFHQGERMSVYMQSTAGDMLVLVVFGRESNPGLVRLYANESCLNLDRQMQAAQTPAQRQGPPPVFEIDYTKQPFTRAAGYEAG